MKETILAIFERTSILIILLGAILLIIGASEALVISTVSLQIPNTIWKTIIGIVGLLFILFGFFLVWRETEKSKTVGVKGETIFLDEFPKNIHKDVDNAEEIWIIGNTLSRAISNHYSLIEQKLKQGKRINYLLIHPDGIAVKMAEERVYGRVDVERRISTTKLLLSDLCKLRSIAPDRLQIRTILNPLSYGAVMINPLAEKSVVYIENYPYKVAGGAKPKYVVQGTDKKWFELYKKEMINLWENGQTWSCEQVEQKI